MDDVRYDCRVVVRRLRREDLGPEGALASYQPLKREEAAGLRAAFAAHLGIRIPEATRCVFGRLADGRFALIGRAPGGKTSVVLETTGIRGRRLRYRPIKSLGTPAVLPEVEARALLDSVFEGTGAWADTLKLAADHPRRVERDARAYSRLMSLIPPGRRGT